MDIKDTETVSVERKTDEATLAYQREYYAKRRAELAARRRELYQQNRDDALVKARERRQKNRGNGTAKERPKYDPEKYKQYYKEHRDRIRELRKLSDERNREKIQARNAAYYEKHRDELVQKERDKRGTDPFVQEARERREFFKEHPTIRRVWWAFRAMITWERLRELAPQLENGPCDICGKTGQVMRFDHDHKTLKFRGLLCHGCNVSLGHFADDPVILQRAIAYLQRAAEVNEFSETPRSVGFGRHNQ